VPPDELTKIFDAFYRVETARTRETGGVGLGLSIVRMCAEACGGTVSAHPPGDGGTGLDVVLRLAASAPPIPRAEMAPEEMTVA
jgi:signal transduction histidine kinase